MGWRQASREEGGGDEGGPRFPDHQWGWEAGQQVVGHAVNHIASDISFSPSLKSFSEVTQAELGFSW